MSPENQKNKLSLLYIHEWVHTFVKSKKEKLKEIKKYLHQKTFSKISVEAHNKVFSGLDCLDCANCFRMLPPIINETDVSRLAKFLKMKPTDFKAAYVSYDEDDDRVLRQTPCAFLLNDNKCNVYEARPRACREYPHTESGHFKQHMKLHEKNILYCPAVFQIVKMIKTGLSQP
ncbi:MAG: Flagellin N-methylase [Bacteroidetes bacterium ADurb.Bin408]|nr:MAG: Flagellin N-methylase [Bacteroidetes bacterium ADurb.Bin408]